VAWLTQALRSDKDFTSLRADLRSPAALSNARKYQTESGDAVPYRFAMAL